MPFDPHCISIGSAGAEPTRYQRGLKALLRPFQITPMLETWKALKYMFREALKLLNLN